MTTSAPRTASAMPLAACPPCPASAASAAPKEQQVLFRATGVKKHYPGVKALDGVDLEGYAGEVLGVCGANGARSSPVQPANSARAACRSANWA